MKKFISPIFVLIALFTLSGCSMKSHKKERPKQTSVKLESKSGSKVSGVLYLEDHYGGVIVTGKVSGLKPGLHGFHIHENPDCSAADASSAGGHFHIDDQKHGAPGEPGSHLGDMGNIEAGKDGTAEVNVYVKGAQLGKGPTSFSGHSIIIHADPDDLKSQPAGNSGKRIACGVIQADDCGCCGCGEKKSSHHHEHDKKDDAK